MGKARTIAMRQELTHVTERRELEVQAALIQHLQTNSLEQDVLDASNLRVICVNDGVKQTDLQAVDAVVLAKDTVYIASHKTYAKGAK